MPRKPTQEMLIKDELIAELTEANAQRFFAGIEDPRMMRTQLHPLNDILMLALCAILSGAQSWSEVEAYGVDKEEMLRRFLGLPNGIPSHDTIGRVFGLICPKRFSESFLAWTRSLVPRVEGLVAIDGKTIRGSGAGGRSPIHLVSAWSQANKVVLAQVRTAEKSNEITAIPELLAALDVTGLMISIDAMGCQRDIARLITSRGGDYLLSLKANQAGMLDTVRRLFEGAIPGLEGKILTMEQPVISKKHGRIDTRRCSVCCDVEWVRLQHEWPCLGACIMVERTRMLKGKESTERAYYISSRKTAPELFNEFIRGHWSIENELHWVLDVAFNEDRAMVRVRHAAENFALLRKIALNLFKIAPVRRGARRNMLAAGWNNDHLLSLLVGLGKLPM